MRCFGPVQNKIEWEEFCESRIKVNVSWVLGVSTARTVCLVTSDQRPDRPVGETFCKGFTFATGKLDRFLGKTGSLYRKPPTFLQSFFSNQCVSVQCVISIGLSFCAQCPCLELKLSPDSCSGAGLFCMLSTCYYLYFTLPSHVITFRWPGVWPIPSICPLHWHVILSRYIFDVYDNIDVQKDCQTVANFVAMIEEEATWSWKLISYTCAVFRFTAPQTVMS